MRYPVDNIKAPAPEALFEACEGSLAAVLKALAPLTPDDRKRVLHAASAFYRVER